MRHTFLLGCILYPTIELCYRRRTHPAMALAGGLSLSLLARIHRNEKNRSLWQQALKGGFFITGIELAIGFCFNRRYQIWDYRKIPMNLFGQICVPFTLAWCALSVVVLAGMHQLDRRL